VTSEKNKETIQKLCAGLDRRLVEEFFARMDEDYFASFAPEKIAEHIQMAAGLGPKNPIQIQVAPQSGAGNEFEITVVGFDYLSEFSIFCGLISAFGLDIHSGDIYSFSASRSHPGPRKIVDVFNVRANPNAPFDAGRQESFIAEMRQFARLLATGDIQEPRERLNRFLVERIEKMNQPLTGLLSPVEIGFDNGVSGTWTLMHTEAEDTFALLYAISNALAMRGIYIHNVKIRSTGSKAENGFLIADRWGRKIDDAGEQKRLRTAVAMIKQFTHFLPEAPDAAKAMRHFDQFLDKMAEVRSPDHILSFLAEKEGMNLLAHLLGSSDYLWDDFLGVRFNDLLPILQDLNQTSIRPDPSALRTALLQAATWEDKKRVLNQYKDAELFRIDAKHLLQPGVTLVDFSLAITELAEIVLSEAANICYEALGAGAGSYAICGLGKFGGREMGYASDLEVLFVHETGAKTTFFEMLVRRITELIEARSKGIFHIDLRLRPYGDAGSWSIPFDEFAGYYSPTGAAAPFERQALIKLRWVAGDAVLGRRVEAHRDAFTYSGAEWDWKDALHLRKRQMRELVKPGDINVKYSAGGIVDIEYAVQYLQLMRGKEYESLRLTNTLDALDALHGLNLVSIEDYKILHSAYLFLRRVIDALRIVRGDASDLVLPPQDSEEFKSLARRLSYKEKDRTANAELLAADLRQHMTTVHDLFLARYDK
jgi:glutamate-ammonia-ligase adenylyltransferase